MTSARHPLDDTIIWFDRYDDANGPMLGGKNASLGSLMMAGLPVPLGFAVTTEAYRRTLRPAGIADRLLTLVADVDVADPAALAAAGSAARDAVLRTPLPPWLLEQMDRAYRMLSGRCGLPDVPVAIRSSATGEDQPDASFAGMHETYLCVRSTDDVAQSVLRCWASLYTDRAIAYRRRLGYPEPAAAMSVGVQRMVFPTAAGVAFTLNPLDGDRSQVVVEAAWGLGEAVVAGVVTPDNFVVDKQLGRIIRRTISPKMVEHRAGADGTVVEVAVDEARRHAPCVTDGEVRAVARLAGRAEDHYGCAQDVEWAVDPVRPDGDAVWLLQSRPETVWSRTAAVER